MGVLEVQKSVVGVTSLKSEVRMKQREWNGYMNTSFIPRDIPRDVSRVSNSVPRGSNMINKHDVILYI